MDQLILLLGKGPSSLDLEGVQAGEYRQTTYFPFDRPDETYETPFIAEALIHLADKDFERVHILGTSGSIWEVLLEHAGEDFDEATVEELLSLKEDDLDDFPDHLRNRLRERVGSHLGVTVEPHLIPVGKSEKEYWEMLRRLASLDIQKGRISIDITHSIRAHPIFLLLALVYFRAVREDLALGSVYYGARVLADSHFEGRAPIFDLRPMIELFDWIDAAQAFDRYGDATPLANLLRESDADVGDLAKRAEYVSRVLQLNMLSKVKTNTSQLLGQLRALPDNNPLPLELIEERLWRFPQQIQGEPLWKVMLIVARQHWNSYRAGPAVLATWEAVIERITSIYDRDAENYEMHKAARRLATDERGWPRGTDHLNRFPNQASKLKEIRNAVAHVRQGRQEDVQPDRVYAEFPRLLNYFEEALTSEVLDSLSDAVSISSYENNE